MLKIISVVGARPQFVKASVVSREIASRGAAKEILLHTGQHYDDNMSRIFFDELGIPEPSYNLGIGGHSHGKQTGRMLEALEQVLLDEKPDWVMVYGDTDSTLAGALAASKLHIPLTHVEAGLRSYNRRMPEEQNRVVADHLSDLLFAPTAAAVANLSREGISGEMVVQSGDVMYDAALHFGGDSRRAGTFPERLGLAPQGYVLATVHRAENTDDPQRLRCIFEALSLVAECIPVVLPLHPRTARSLKAQGLFTLTAKFRLLEPLGYLDMLSLLKNAQLVATDSGGVQKEAYFFRRPCVTFRDETEWVELLTHGWNVLASPRLPSRDVCGVVLDSLRMKGEEVELYGRAEASKIIVDALFAKI